MPALFEAKTANGAWQKAYHALNSEHGALQDSRLGETKEILHASFYIQDPLQRWVLSRSPGMNPAFAIVECFWILAGRNDAGMINFWNPAYPRFAGNGDTYAGAYGKRLRSNFGLDQVARVANALRNNPKSRQAILQIWDPGLDLPNDNGDKASDDIPCNICSMPKVRNGRLEWFQVMRSNDLFRGTPHNFVQFTTLQELMAGWLGLKIGPYYHVSDSLHYYMSDEPKFGCDQDLDVPKNNDALSLSWNAFEEVLGTSIKLLDVLCDGALTTSQFMQLLSSLSLPPAYRNMIAVAAADSARRRGWDVEMEKAMEFNSNSVFLMAWDRWLARKSLVEGS